MATFSVCLAVLAMLLHGSAFLLYNLKVRGGASRPNPASWAIWAVLTIVNVSSFSAMTDLVSSMQFLVGTLGCLATFLYALTTGKFSPPKPEEWAYLIAGVAAVFMWWLFQSAAVANIIVILAIVVSFKPTVEMVQKNPHQEMAMPWRIWTLAFALTTLNLIIRDQSALSFIAPISLLLAHGTVAVVAKGEKKRVLELSRP